MSKIKLSESKGFTLVPAGEQNLTITKIEVLPNLKKPKTVAVEYTHKNGGKINSTMDLDRDAAIVILSILIRVVTGQNDLEEFDLKDLSSFVGAVIVGEVAHVEVEDKEDDTKVRTFANLKKLLSLVENDDEDDTDEDDEDLDDEDDDL